MKIRSKAPLRLGIGGGGTDVSPYSDTYGGCVLNATIDLYAYAYLDTEAGQSVSFEAKDLMVSDSFLVESDVDINEGLLLHRAVYLRVMRQFNGGKRIPLNIVTHSDAPAGSGLGSSSTMVVAMLEAYRQLLNLPLGEYDLAHLAYEIEREDCGLSGGKQDQYAAAFGGFNFIEFYQKDRVIVNPLRIRRYIVNELEASLILFYTGASRESATIIEDQKYALEGTNNDPLLAMHRVKESCFALKELLFKSDIDGMAKVFGEAWIHKKSTAKTITNPQIDAIENAVISAGAKSMKVSGAGGGGFVMIFVEPEMRLNVTNALAQFCGQVHKFKFTDEGVYSWTI